MTSEPLTTTTAAQIDTSERGMLIAVLFMVLAGVGAMLLMI